MRDAASKLNMQMIETLEKCTVENMEETIRMCHAVASVSDNPTFLTREAQVHECILLLEVALSETKNTLKQILVM